MHHSPQMPRFHCAFALSFCGAVIPPPRGVHRIKSQKRLLQRSLLWIMVGWSVLCARQRTVAEANARHTLLVCAGTSIVWRGSPRKVPPVLQATRNWHMMLQMSIKLSRARCSRSSRWAAGQRHCSCSCGYCIAAAGASSNATIKQSAALLGKPVPFTLVCEPCGDLVHGEPCACADNGASRSSRQARQPAKRTSNCGENALCASIRVR